MRMWHDDARFEPTSHAVAADRRADGSWERLNSIHQLLTHFRELVRGRTRKLGDFVKIGSGRKEAVIAGDDDRPRLLRQLEQPIGQRNHASARKPIRTIVRDEPQQCYSGLRFYFKKLTHRFHRYSRIHLS